MLGIHAEYTTSLDRMEYLSDLAAKYQAPCFTHLCETKEEAEGCIKRYGMSAPLLLDKIGFYRYGGGGFHCCYLTEEDIRYFADHNLWAVTCPASNLKLASGIAPVEQMRKAGVKLAIGTDGASSNNALDMFREMYLVTALQKIYEEDASACPASEVLKMACVNGAHAIGLPDCDDISAGKLADITVINLRRPNMRPLNNLTANLVYAGSKENVRLTMVNGRILYENGEFFIGEDPDEIYCAAEEFVRSLEA
jgi:5-methylthioadenosine/S-adenosylhomocysteine deaminase